MADQGQSRQFDCTLLTSGLPRIADSPVRFDEAGGIGPHPAAPLMNERRSVGPHTRLPTADETAAIGLRAMRWMGQTQQRRYHLAQ